MTPNEARNLIETVRADYIAMVRELNSIKRLKRPVDPYKMPLVEAMGKAIRDLTMADGQALKQTTQ